MKDVFVGRNCQSLRNRTIMSRCWEFWNVSAERRSAWLETQLVTVLMDYLHFDRLYTSRFTCWRKTFFCLRQDSRWLKWHMHPLSITLLTAHALYETLWTEETASMCHTQLDSGGRGCSSYLSQCLHLSLTPLLQSLPRWRFRFTEFDRDKQSVCLY